MFKNLLWLFGEGMTQFSLSLSLVSFSCRRRVAVGLFCHRRIRTRRRAGWRPPGARPGPRHGERVFLAGVLKRSFSPETSLQLLVGPSPGASALCHFPSSLLFSPSTSPSPGCSGADGRRTSCTVEVLLINWVFSDDFFHRSVLTGSHVTVPHQSPHVANVLCLICKTVPSRRWGNAIHVQSSLRYLIRRRKPRSSCPQPLCGLPRSSSRRLSLSLSPEQTDETTLDFF